MQGAKGQMVKKALTAPAKLRMILLWTDTLIPSWWRDGPDETQQPASGTGNALATQLPLDFQAKVLTCSKDVSLNDKSERRDWLKSKPFHSY